MTRLEYTFAIEIAEKIERELASKDRAIEHCRERTKRAMIRLKELVEGDSFDKDAAINLIDEWLYS